MNSMIEKTVIFEFQSINIMVVKLLETYYWNFFGKIVPIWENWIKW